jgi:uncharacterized protein (DUF952 family)
MSETENKQTVFIYHLVLRAEFLSQIRDNSYKPLRFSEDGFIHCTEGEDMTVLVANDYFSKANDLLILKINLKKIQAKVLFEKPIPIQGGGNSHLKKDVLFPHIYGSLNLDSIEGIGTMPKINYVFHFPKSFMTQSQFIEGNRWT